MRFVDLFAGLGGFHLALSRLEHECVFASEIDAGLAELYFKNFKMRTAGDITRIKASDIPSHDFLCAGFPCQPFSKAGEQAGLECEKSGNLFGAITRIIREHRPKYVLLENVANLERHDGGHTWKRRIKRRLTDAGYTVDAKILSPDTFGIPQKRPRFFIVAARDGLNDFKWPEPPEKVTLDIASVLDRLPAEATRLGKQQIDCLNVWQDFLDKAPPDVSLSGFPKWSMEWKANYPFEKDTPYGIGVNALSKFRGCHGTRISGGDWDEQALCLPSYARDESPNRFPQWKQEFITDNRRFYAANKSWIDGWMPDILRFPQSLQKFEWNCKGDKRDLWKTVIQFRASGVRCKRATTAPSLVAMTTTQVPIIAWEKRYMTPRECSRLQSMEDWLQLPENQTRAFKALGNSVNVDVVEMVAAALIATGKSTSGPRRTKPRRMSAAV